LKKGGVSSYMVPRLSDATRDVPTNFKKVEFDGLTTSSDAASRGVPSKPLRRSLLDTWRKGDV